MQDAGFKLGSVTVAPAAVDVASQSSVPIVIVPPPAQPTPASIIASQVPAAGQKVVAGSAVSVEVR